MKTIVTGFAAALIASTSALAADLYQPEQPPLVSAPEITVKEASGWYLRGDIGYSFNDLKGAKFLQGHRTPTNWANFGKADLDDSAVLGVGVGYQINSYLRTDLTFDHMFKSDFSGSTTGTCGSPAVACTSRDQSAMRAYTLMANAYVDLGTYASITPYIGAGIGGSYVKWDSLKNTACEDGSGTCYGTDVHGGRGDWRLTYALMAGASYDISCNLKADVGYRYRHIAKGDMFSFLSSSTPGGGTQGWDKGINSHEIRVGARYMFNGCETQAYQPPPLEPAPPLVYK